MIEFQKKIKTAILLIVAASSFSLIETAYSQDISSKISEIEISNPQVIKEQALILYGKGDYEEALKYLENFKSDYVDEEVTVLTSNCYESLGNYEKAAETLKKLIQIDPESFVGYYNLGVLYYGSKDFEDARDSFEKAYKLNKNSYALTYNLGCAYFELQNFKKAVEFFTKAYKLYPDEVKTYYNLALSYEKLNNIKESKKYFEMYNKTKSI
jgi:tetratricopeptide (TPR) repeat protein